MLEFVNFPGYLGGVVPSAEADRIYLKHLIDGSLLIGDHSIGDHQVAFGKFKISFIHLLLVFSLFGCVFKQ